MNQEGRAEDIDYNVAVLVHRSPQILPLPLDVQEQFVQMPCVAQRATSAVLTHRQAAWQGVRVVDRVAISWKNQGGHGGGIGVIGAAWRFDEAFRQSEDSSTVNASFIERLNLTIRQGSAYLSRRTLSHARATDTLEAHLELLRCYYNFVRPHGALTFGHETRTPAMQAGLATRRLTLRDIFVSLRRVVLWLSNVQVFADARRTAAPAVMYMPVAA